jgi:hypothetical protein
MREDIVKMSEHTKVGFGPAAIATPFALKQRRKPIIENRLGAPAALHQI